MITTAVFLLEIAAELPVHDDVLLFPSNFICLKSGSSGFSRKALVSSYIISSSIETSAMKGILVIITGMVISGYHGYSSRSGDFIIRKDSCAKYRQKGIFIHSFQLLNIYEMRIPQTLI